MGTARRVVGEASTYMAGLAGAAILQFLAVPVFTRYLGPDEYSLLALSLAVSTSISGLLLIGGDLALSRFWFSAGDGHERRSFTVTWILFLTAWSIPVVALACAAAPMISGWVSPSTSITVELQIAFVILVPAQLSRMLAQVMRNEFRPWPFAVTSTAIAGLSLVIGLWLAVGLDLGVAGVLMGSVAGESLGVFIRAPLVMPALQGSLSRRLIRAPLLFGLPFVPASVAFWVFTGMDRVAVGRFMSEADLGAYAVAGMLVAPFTILLTALGQAWVPRITQEFEADSRKASLATGVGLELSLIAYGMAAVLGGRVCALADQHRRRPRLRGRCGSPTHVGYGLSTSRRLSVRLHRVHIGQANAVGPRHHCRRRSPRCRAVVGSGPTFRAAGRGSSGRRVLLHLVCRLFVSVAVLLPNTGSVGSSGDCRCSPGRCGPSAEP